MRTTDAVRIVRWVSIIALAAISIAVGFVLSSVVIGMGAFWSASVGIGMIAIGFVWLVLSIQLSFWDHKTPYLIASNITFSLGVIKIIAGVVILLRHLL